MDRHATPRARAGRRATAPKLVRQVARAAHLSLRKFAEAIIDGQPPPERPGDQQALLHWLAQSVRSEHPGASLDQLAEAMAGRLQGVANGGDATAKALQKAEVHDVVMKLVQVEMALAGTRWVPMPPTVPKQQRIDSIAATVLELTGWTSVDSETVDAIYRWLFGDEALFVAGTEMRVQAGRRMFDNQDPSPVHVPHPDTGDLVLVTREEILEHANADRRVLDADVRYAEQLARWHARLTRALRPYGDQGASVGEAVERAARDLGIEQAGRSFEEFAGLVVAAAEARNGSAAG